MCTKRLAFFSTPSAPLVPTRSAPLRTSAVWRRVFRRRRSGAAMVPYALGQQLLGNVASSDFLLTGGALSLASAIVGGTAALRTRGAVSGRTARKVVHASAGVAYVVLWRWWESRWAALILPGTALCFALVARGVLAGIVGRGTEVDAKDALQGPTLYIGVLAALTIVLWHQPAAYVAVAQLCLGDAAAEIAGRALGASNRWPFAKQKSAAGSLAFVVAGACGSFALLYWHALLDGDQSLIALKVIGISVACAAAELLPQSLVGDDNLSVAVTAAVLAHWWL